MTGRKEVGMWLQLGIVVLLALVFVTRLVMALHRGNR